MERAGEARKGAKARTSGRPLLLKVAAWTLAIPALCVAVIAGGAVPLYLLLPEAEPAAQAVVEAAPAPRAPAAVAAVVPAVEAASPPEAEAIDEGTTGATTPDEAPDESAAPPAETTVAAVVPTPRPSLPLPYKAPRSDAAVAETKAPPPKPEPAPQKETRAEAARAEQPVAGRRTVIRADARLRAAPRGAQLGVLPEGTEVIVGRCERWCEVSVGGRRGYVYAALVDGRSGKRDAQRPAERRIEARRDRRIEEQPRRFVRREYSRPAYDPRDEDLYADDRAYGGEDDLDWLPDDRGPPMRDPDWYVEDERPIMRGGPPMLVYEGRYR